MTRKAFDKIAAGLKDAIAIARGEAKPARFHLPAKLTMHIENRDGLFVATSHDLKGMLIAEYSLDALKDAIPQGVQDLCAAYGFRVVVSKLDTSDDNSLVYRLD